MAARKPWFLAVQAWADKVNSREEDPEISELTFALESRTWFNREVADDCV